MQIPRKIESIDDLRPFFEKWYKTKCGDKIMIVDIIKNAIDPIAYETEFGVNTFTIDLKGILDEEIDFTKEYKVVRQWKK